MKTNLAGQSDVGRRATVQFMPGGPRIFRRDFASSYGWWGNLAVVLGRKPPSAEHVVNYRACVTDLHRQYPQGVSLITVVNDTSTPEASGRDAMIKMFKDIWPMLDAALFVPNASGFKAAVMRSVIGGFILASGQRDRVRVEGNISSGLPWLSTKLAMAGGQREQLRSLEQGISDFCAVESQWEESGVTTTPGGSNVSGTRPAQRS
jgi:hypothetical protein